MATRTEPTVTPSDPIPPHDAHGPRGKTVIVHIAPTSWVGRLLAILIGLLVFAVVFIASLFVFSMLLTTIAFAIAFALWQGTQRNESDRSSEP